MNFREIEEGKLYQHGEFANVYTKKDGLLYNIGVIFGEWCGREGLELDMYYCNYAPKFILDMEFTEIRLGRI